MYSCSECNHGVTLSLETKRNHIPPIFGFGETVLWDAGHHRGICDVYVTLSNFNLHSYQFSLSDFHKELHSVDMDMAKNLIDLTDDKFRF